MADDLVGIVVDLVDLVDVNGFILIISHAIVAFSIPGLTGK